MHSRYLFSNIVIYGIFVLFRKLRKRKDIFLVSCERSVGENNKFIVTEKIFCQIFSKSNDCKARVGMHQSLPSLVN